MLLDLHPAGCLEKRGSVGAEALMHSAARLPGAGRALLGAGRSALSGTGSMAKAVGRLIRERDDLPLKAFEGGQKLLGLGNRAAAAAAGAIDSGIDRVPGVRKFLDRPALARAGQMGDRVLNDLKREVGTVADSLNPILNPQKYMPTQPMIPLMALDIPSGGVVNTAARALKWTMPVYVGAEGVDSPVKLSIGKLMLRYGKRGVGYLMDR